MLLRRLGLLPLSLLAVACAPGVDKTPGPSEIDYAVFDVTSAVPQIPQPNDLVLQSDISALPLPAAQKALLREFQLAKGFPNDQEVAITIDFQSVAISSTGLPTASAPDLDVSTVVPGQTLVVLASSGGVASSISAATLAPITDADYVKGADRGTLTIHNNKHLRWTAGSQYFVGLRGGPNGVKLKNGNPVAPSSTTFLLTQDKDLSQAENQTLIQLQLGSRAAAAGAGAQLEGIRKTFLKFFPSVDPYFSHKELALTQTFQIASNTGVHVETDPGAGLIPLPSNFLLDPANGGKTIVYNPALGSCPANTPPSKCPAAAGLATLDGFSTTAMILAQVSGTIVASTITKDTVLLYEMTGNGPKYVDPSGSFTDPNATADTPHVAYEVQPAAITQTPAGTSCAAAPTLPCLTNVIGLQPAAPATSNGLRSTPLKDATTYGVVITTKVKDLNNAPLTKSTIAKILLFDDAIASGTGSNLIGVDAGTASGLEAIRLEVKKLVAQATADGKINGKDQVALAYTFRTQSITSPSIATPTSPSIPLQLVAAPYAKLTPQGANFPIAAVVPDDAATTFKRYGIATSGLDTVGAVPSDNIQFGFDAKIVTLNLLDPATGAFRPNQDACVGTLTTSPPNPCLEVIKALVVLPKPNLVTGTCATADGTLKCAPLVVFRHGINNGRGSALLIANAMAAKGFVTVAIDAAKQGERAYCTADNQCTGGQTCVIDPAQAGQGDARAPGTCGGALGGNYLYRPVLCPGFDPTSPTPSTANCTAYDRTKGGIPVSSGAYLISANFFRTRDTFRQDILDQSQLINVMTSKSASPTQLHAVYEVTKALGYKIDPDPSHTYFVGQSLGGINGTMDASVNPNISKVALNVAGGTLVDVFTNSLSFKPQVDPLLASLGIDRVNNPGGYLQFLSIAKWILDPADPINYATFLKTKALKSFKTGFATDIPAKKVLAQRAQCDKTVPDVFEILLFDNANATPDQILPNPAPPPATIQFQGTVFTKDPTKQAPSQCGEFFDAAPAYAATHAFLTDWSNASLTSQAQADIAQFFATDAIPASFRYPLP